MAKKNHVRHEIKRTFSPSLFYGLQACIIQYLIMLIIINENKYKNKHNFMEIAIKNFLTFDYFLFISFIIYVNINTHS